MHCIASHRIATEGGESVCGSSIHVMAYLVNIYDLEYKTMSTISTISNISAISTNNSTSHNNSINLPTDHNGKSTVKCYY